MMSENSVRPSSTSSVSSISLLEIKAETSLVLKAFLRQSLALPLADRPGRVGGAYKDDGKYSVQLRPKAKNGFHSQDEEVSSGDEKKKGLKNFIRRTIRRPTKDPGQEHKDPTSSLEKDARPQGVPSPAVALLRDHLLPEQDDTFSPSSTSEEDDGEQRQRKKQKKRNKLKKQLSELFRRKVARDSPEKPEPRPQRPSKLSIGTAPRVPDPLVSPNHPPAFYEEVAERLEQIAQRSHSIKRIKPGALPVQPQSPPPTPPTTVKPTEPVVNKDEVVRQLIQVLSMEADAITSKIQSDPFLRSKLTRLSYPSFAKLLDAFSNSEVEQPPVPLPALLPASPTLRRVAVTMEVSRRVVTATGAQRMQGYAERYMETFAPWVKRNGGWENIVHLEEFD